MSKYTWLIDEGHGGVNPSGEYMTDKSEGKQYTFVPIKPKLTGDKKADDEEKKRVAAIPLSKGATIFEGLVNRQIGKLVKDALKKKKIDFESMNDPIFNTSLSDRVLKADNFFNHGKNKAIFVSIHNDKLTKKTEIEGEGQDKVTAATIYTSKGQTKSDLVADVFAARHRLHFKGDIHLREEKTDGDADIEADFYVLRKTDCPAILLECTYFDNRVSAAKLMDKKFLQKIADWIVDSIEDVEANLSL